MNKSSEQKNFKNAAKPQKDKAIMAPPPTTL